MRRFALVAACLLLLPASLSASKDWQPLELVIHVHTKVSTGELTAEEVITEARDSRLDGVLFTDSLLRHWEYGFWPLQAWIKKSVNEPSVRSYGTAKYLQTIRGLNQEQGLLALAGIEAAPFYYWQHGPFDKLGGEIRDWNQHLLVFGLDKPQALEQLPVNVFDPHHGDRQSLPYQDFIDEASALGGLVFWAHPFTKHEGRHGSISDSTESYPHLLEATLGYHGFAITYFGYLDAVAPGMLWDGLLMQYCQGKRALPVWVIGESDWRSPKERPLKMVVTQFFSSERSPKAVLDAMREGRMWAMMRANDTAPVLSEFSILDESTGKKAISGNHMTVGGELTIRISGRRPKGASGKLKLTLVKDGMIFYEEELDEAQFFRQWPDHKPTGMSYYRLIVEDPGGVVFTNPVFVRPKN